MLVTQKRRRNTRGKNLESTDYIKMENFCRLEGKKLLKDIDKPGKVFAIYMMHKGIIALVYINLLK